METVSSRDYYQEEIAPMQYAYKTSRAIPAFEDNGEYAYYERKYSNWEYYNYNILNELDNSSYGQEGAGLTVNANLQFKFNSWLNANAIASYSNLPHDNRRLVGKRNLSCGIIEEEQNTGFTQALHRSLG